MEFPGSSVLRICLPVGGTWVWSLLWEDPTCLEVSYRKKINYSNNFTNAGQNSKRWTFLLRKEESGADSASHPVE